MAPSGRWHEGARMRRTALWLAGISAALVLVVMCLQRVWSVDYWWLLKVGEDAWNHGPPKVDLYSYTNPGSERLELRWGFCIVLFHIVEWFGHAGATIGKTLLVALMFVLSLLAAGKDRWKTIAASVLVVIAAMACSQRLVARPETVSNLLLAAYVFLIARRMDGPSKLVWLIPLLQVVWVNVHGLFALGPAVVGAWLTGELIEAGAERLGWRERDDDRRARLRTAAMVLGATFAASFINPYGYRAVLLPLLQFHALHGTAQKGWITELSSPFAFAQTYTAVRWWQAMIAIALVSGALNWRRQRAFWIILVLSQLYLSIAAIRNIPLFCLVAMPYVLRNLAESPVWARLRGLRHAGAAGLLASVAVAAFAAYQTREVVTDRAAIRQGDTNQFGLGLARARYARRSTAFLREAGVQGPIFNSPSAGSYLLHEGFKVFIDPRMEVYHERIIDEFRGLSEHPERLDEYTERYGFEALVLDNEVERLIVAAAKHPRWRLAFIGPVATVLLREDKAGDVPRLDLNERGGEWLRGIRQAIPEVRAYEDAGLLTRLSNPAPYVRLGRLAYLLGAPGVAAQLFSDALRAYPPGFAAENYVLLSHAASQAGDGKLALESAVRGADQHAWHAGLNGRAAALLLNEGQADRAGTYAERAIAADPGSLDGLTVRGVLQLNSGRHAEAEKTFRALLKVQPDRVQFHRFLGGALLAQKKGEEALAAMSRAAELSPNDGTTARDVAGILASLGRLEEARTWARRAATLNPDDRATQELLRRLEAQGK